MKIRIENGCTIISTGDATGGLKNKNGHTGIHWYGRDGKYRADIHYKKKKYHLGYYDTAEEAIPVRQEAEYHVKAGDFYVWIEQLRSRK